MRIAVCVRFGWDTAELRPDRGTGEPRFSRAPLRIDPFAHNALEAAVQLRDRIGGEVVAVSLVAGEPPRQVVLEVLAGGADEAVLVLDPGCEEADALGVATVLAAALRATGPWDLVLCGDAAADRYERQVGPRTAEILDLPCVTRAVRMAQAGDRLEADRSLEDRIETVRVRLPALVTVTQETNEPRLLPLLQIMAAGSRPTRQLRVSDVGLPQGSLSSSATRRLGIEAPQSRRRRQEIRGLDVHDTAAKLARLLASEGVL